MVIDRMKESAAGPPLSGCGSRRGMRDARESLWSTKCCRCSCCVS